MPTLEKAIAVCGHAQHGKSSLAGRLLRDLGGISLAEIERRWQRAPETVENFDRYRKDFNKYNLIFLEHRGHTFSKGTGEPDDPSRTVFPTRASVSIGDERYTIVDEPGYSRFLGNIVYGIYLADAGVVVVDAKHGVASGTRVVTRLLNFFDIPVLAVCVAKMDEVGFSQTAFETVAAQVRAELVDDCLGYEPPIIPIYALSQAETAAQEPQLAWYSGVTLTEAMQARERKDAVEHVPVRFAVREVFSPPGAGTVLLGVLETGRLSVDDHLVLEPASTLHGTRIAIRCRSLQRARGINEQKQKIVQHLEPRVIAAIATSDLTREQARLHLRHGGMLGPTAVGPNVASHIEAEMIFFTSETVYVGKQYKLQANASDSEATVVRIEGKQKVIDQMQLDEFDALDGDIVRLRLKLERPICIETEQSFQRLTRFVLREKNEVVACGRCIESSS
jgi:elongation factor 1-alpha